MRRVAANHLAAQLQDRGLETLLTFDGPSGYSVLIQETGERATTKTDALKLLRKLRAGSALAPARPRERTARTAN
jgi:hypothetical protein